MAEQTGVVMIWVFVLVLEGKMAATAEFGSEWACVGAGRTVVEEVGESAKYWCFPKDS